MPRKSKLYQRPRRFVKAQGDTGELRSLARVMRRRAQEIGRSPGAPDRDIRDEAIRRYLSPVREKLRRLGLTPTRNLARITSNAYVMRLRGTEYADWLLSVADELERVYRANKSRSVRSVKFGSTRLPSQRDVIRYFRDLGYSLPRTRETMVLGAPGGGMIRVKWTTDRDNAQRHAQALEQELRQAGHNRVASTVRPYMGDANLAWVIMTLDWGETFKSNNPPRKFRSEAPVDRRTLETLRRVGAGHMDEVQAFRFLDALDARLRELEFDTRQAGGNSNKLRMARHAIAEATRSGELKRPALQVAYRLLQQHAAGKSTNPPRKAESYHIAGLEAQKKIQTILRHMMKLRGQASRMSPLQHRRAVEVSTKLLSGARKDIRGSNLRRGALNRLFDPIESALMDADFDDSAKMSRVYHAVERAARRAYSRWPQNSRDYIHYT